MKHHVITTRTGNKGRMVCCLASKEEKEDSASVAVIFLSAFVVTHMRPYCKYDSLLSLSLTENTTHVLLTLLLMRNC